MYIPKDAIPENSRIIIVENSVYNDGIGDYGHLRDILKAVTTNPKFDAYTFIPVIDTGNKKLIEKIITDLASMGITHYYIGDNKEFDIDTELDKALKIIYEKAEQLLEVSTRFIGDQKRFLRPPAIIKSITEHEGRRSIEWKIEYRLPTLTSSMGLHHELLGIKIADVPKTTPQEFYASLAIHDPKMAAQLLKTTGSTNFEELTAKNIFTHAYFTDLFGEKNGFSMFLALLCTHSKDKDIIVQLSSSSHSAIKNYTKKAKHLPDNGIERLHTIINAAFQKSEFAQYVDIKQIEFFSTEYHAPQHIEIINPDGNRVIRVFNAHLSEESYKLVFNACTFVGVSGDNSFERSVAHQILPFYHSTNEILKTPTWKAIKIIIKEVDFGFDEQLHRDLVTYFSYEADKHHGYDFLRKILLIDLDRVQKAWSTIADYLKQHRNFYNLYEHLILMPAPPLEEIKRANGKKIYLATDEQNSCLIPKATEPEAFSYSSAPHVTLFMPDLVQAEETKGSTTIPTTGL